jgi:hypothetical protein
MRSSLQLVSISAGQQFSKDKELKAAAGGVLKC